MAWISGIQLATYLGAICSGTVALLVFSSATSSFVITNILEKRSAIGNATGTLAFADELVALFLCPLWGLIADWLGARKVTTIGFIIVGTSFLLLVQSRVVYPDLLLGHVLFSAGGAALTTMVTTILPLISASDDDIPTSSIDCPVEDQHSASDESAINVSPYQRHHCHAVIARILASPSSLAGVVGFASGLGALIALFFFLRIPALLQTGGNDPKHALVYAYYAVGGVAFGLSLVCFVGLRRLPHLGSDAVSDALNHHNSYGRFFAGLTAVISHRSLMLACLGGFLARSSSVAISTFIPLYVNSFFITTGRCDIDIRDPAASKEQCRDAYVLAATLTGVSQSSALFFALIFGAMSERYRKSNAPLMLAAVVGVIGYLAFAYQGSPLVRGPDGSLMTLLLMVMLGFNQIGAIVCSLGMLGRSIQTAGRSSEYSHDQSQARCLSRDTSLSRPEAGPLITRTSPVASFKGLEGSIAGAYGLFGACGILLLTKCGGVLFDQSMTTAPFYILASFNFIILIAGSISYVRTVGQDKP